MQMHILGDLLFGQRSRFCIVNPEGSVALSWGLSSQGVFFKNLAAKLGIEFLSLRWELTRVL